MAKTKPIGVRFDEDLLKSLKELGIATPQKALIFLENFYMETKNEPISAKSTETPQKSSQKSNVSKQGKVADAPKEAEKNDEWIGGDEVVSKIEQLTIGMNSCADTPLGRKMKALYQKQIKELQTKQINNS